MTIKQLEQARMIILCGSFATKLLTNSEILDLEQISSLCMMTYNISFLTGFHLEQFTKDYKEIENIYNFIVYRIAELIECYGINDDPVKIFALFVYLYRGGYLSKNKDFLYSFDIKDLPVLNGADVIRGRGVCRSISSMFTDVCNTVGLTACNVSVKVSSQSLDKKEQLSPINLSDEKNNKKLARIAGKVMSIFPLANHLVTIVGDGKKVGVFDPTNDIYMNMRSFGKYEFINTTGAKMSYKTISNIFPSLLGQMRTKINLFELYKYSKMEKISYEEYKQKYRELLELIKEKPEIIEAFYQINKELYDRLSTLCEEEHGMLKRMIPIIPEKRRNNRS